MVKNKTILDHARNFRLATIICICISGGLSASTVVGTEGVMMITNPANTLIPGSVLGGIGAFLEVGFEPHTAGLKLTMSYVGGTEYHSLTADKVTPVSRSSFYISTLLKYNTPIAIRSFGKFGITMTQILYVINPWFGLGPAFQLNSSIKSQNPADTGNQQITNPGDDFLVEFGTGFHTNLGMLLSYMNLNTKWRNVYFITDFRYAYNLSFLESKNLKSYDILLDQFTSYWNLKIGFGYRFGQPGKKEL